MTNDSLKNKIRWIHLSDFHVGKDDYGEKQIFNRILEHVRQRKNQGFIPDLIFVTGDVAYSGKDNQYDKFNLEFLEELYKVVGEDKRKNTFFVPGNHDISREINEYFDREAICHKDSHFFDPTLEGLNKRQQILPRFKSYIDKSYLVPLQWINSENGSFTKTVEVRGKNIGIVCINTAWLSRGEENECALSPGINLLEKALIEIKDCHVRIVLGHHPIECFHNEQIQKIEKLLENSNTLYLHGHLHKKQAKPKGYGFLCVQSGAAFQSRDEEKWVNGFLWAELNLSRDILRLQPRQWNPDNFDWPLGKDLPDQMRVQGTDWWVFPLPCPALTLPAVTIKKDLCLTEYHHNSRMPVGYHKHYSFVGRSKEANKFEQFLGSEDLILNCYGISGVGKSWFLNHLIRKLTTEPIGKGYILAHVDCKEIIGNLQSFMNSIARNIGDQRLPNYTSLKNEYYKTFGASHSEEKYFDGIFANNLWDSLFFDLQIVSKTEPLMLFIDSFEKIQWEKTKSVIENKIRDALKNHFGDFSKTRLKVVIAGQMQLKAKQGWDRLLSVKIEPFSREELKEFSEKNLGTSDSAVIAYLLDEWAGDPLELGQLVDLYTKDRSATSADHLTQLRCLRKGCIMAADNEFIERLENRLVDNMHVLSCCAVPMWFDAPVLREMTNSDVEKSQFQINELSKLWFVKPRSCGIGYEIHERYRDPILRRLIKDDSVTFSKYSKRCHEYLKPKNNKKGRHTINREIELIYHLFAFDEEKALVQYNELRYSLGQVKRWDLMEGLQDTIEAHLRFNPKVSPVWRHWIEYGRAIIFYRSGRSDLALKFYEELLKDPELDKFLRARILRAKGDLHRWQGGVNNMDQAKQYFTEAIELWDSLLKENAVSPGITKDDIPKSLAETHVALARMEEIQCNLKEGMNHFRSALKIYRLCETLGPSYGRTLGAIGRNLRLQGKWEEAHRHFDKAEEAFNSLLKKVTLGDVRVGKRREEIESRLQAVRNARAALWKEEGKWNEAKVVLAQVIAFHNSKPKEVRNQEALGIALIDFGDILRMEGGFIKAKQIYQEAQESLQRSEVNKGYPLLGLAEIAVIEGEEEKALEYLSKAEKTLSKFNYARKLCDLALCRAKLTRKVNLKEAIKTLEEAWERICITDCTYTKSNLLVDLADLIYEAERDSARFRNYRKQAKALAGQKQGLFTEHLARLCFLDGRIAGEEEPVRALPAFIDAMAWAVRHNTLTLQRIVSKAVIWLNDHLNARTESALGKEELLPQEIEADICHSEEIALSALPEDLRMILKNAVMEIKQALGLSSGHINQ